MARESRLWEWLSGARQAFGPKLHMCRVENSIMSGWPDVEGKLLDHEAFWIELKSSVRPDRSSTPVRFKVRDRQAQVEWARKRSEVGGLTWLLLQVGHGSRRGIYLVPGSCAQEVYDGVVEDRLRVLNCLGTTKPTPSEVIERASTRLRV